jgi:phosphoglycerate dehydrogenase-like enzyme
MSILWMCLDPDELRPVQRNAVEASVPDMDVVVTRDLDEVKPLAADVEIMSGWIGPEMIRAMPAVRWVQHWAAGVNRLVADPEIVQRDFVLTNGSGIHAIPISEHIFAFLLSMARGLPCAVRAQSDHRWVSPSTSCNRSIFELFNKTMVLIGVGAIGARTAEVARSLGMHVIGVRRDPSDDAVSGVGKMVGPEALGEVLPKADVVVLTVPLTDETEAMIGEPELRAMKASAHLVNIGRGGTVDERALTRALQQGWIAGAGLDVFETEPLPEDSPLWEMENVVITSHYAGRTPHYTERAMALFFDNLGRYLHDEPLCNVVDKDRGY